eukprot:5857040-Alexandrium_andersonii.AAC.1
MCIRDRHWALHHHTHIPSKSLQHTFASIAVYKAKLDACSLRGPCACPWGSRSESFFPAIRQQRAPSSVFCSASGPQGSTWDDVKRTKF